MSRIELGHGLQLSCPPGRLWQGCHLRWMALIQTPHWLWWSLQGSCCWVPRWLSLLWLQCWTESESTLAETQTRLLCSELSRTTCSRGLRSRIQHRVSLPALSRSRMRGGGCGVGFDHRVHNRHERERCPKCSSQEYAQRWLRTQRSPACCSCSQPCEGQRRGSLLPQHSLGLCMQIRWRKRHIHIHILNS